MIKQKDKLQKVQEYEEKTVVFKRPSDDKVLISWIAPEYLQYNKGMKWYVIAGLLVIITAFIAFATGNWSMAMAVIVLAIVYQVTHSYHPPKNVKVEISEMGIQVGEMFFPYSHIKAFWIIHHHGAKTLNLHVSKRFFSDVVIQLHDQDPVLVRQYLVTQIPEWEGKNERLSDIILRLLRL